MREKMKEGEEGSCLFCDFVHNRRGVHEGRYPFKVLHETKHTISFLSIDFPATVDGHTLVIPKKHYANLEDIPKHIQNDLMSHVSLVSEALRKGNEANNVLLNNGWAAGQRIFHVHFHLIPRNNKDGIKIEVWKHKKPSKEAFMKLHNKVKRAIAKQLNTK